MQAQCTLRPGKIDVARYLNLAHGRIGIPGAMEQKTRLRNQESSSIASDELRRGRSCPRWTASGTEKT